MACAGHDLAGLNPAVVSEARSTRRPAVIQAAGESPSSVFTFARAVGTACHWAKLRTSMKTRPPWRANRSTASSTVGGTGADSNEDQRGRAIGELVGGVFGGEADEAVGEEGLQVFDSRVFVGQVGETGPTLGAAVRGRGGALDGKLDVVEQDAAHAFADLEIGHHVGRAVGDEARTCIRVQSKGPLGRRDVGCARICSFSSMQ